MGITIAFKGRLNSPDLIYPFCNELSDTAKDMNWDYQTLDEDFNKPNTAYLDRESPVIRIKGHLALKGISLSIHPDAGSLSFYFDKNGDIRDIIAMLTERENEDLKSNYGIIKTQFAPVEVHITVVKLLRYIKKKYINDLIVIDEGEYWETNDKNILYEKMEFLRQKNEQVEDILKNTEITINDAESPISIADKIENILAEKFDRTYNGEGIEEVKEKE